MHPRQASAMGLFKFVPVKSQMQVCVDPCWWIRPRKWERTWCHQFSPHDLDPPALVTAFLVPFLPSLPLTLHCPMEPLSCLACASPSVVRIGQHWPSHWYTKLLRCYERLYGTFVIASTGVAHILSAAEAGWDWTWESTEDFRVPLRISEIWVSPNNGQNLLNFA